MERMTPSFRCKYPFGRSDVARAFSSWGFTWESLVNLEIDFLESTSLGDSLVAMVLAAALAPLLYISSRSRRELDLAGRMEECCFGNAWALQLRPDSGRPIFRSEVHSDGGAVAWALDEPRDP